MTSLRSLGRRAPPAAPRVRMSGSEAAISALSTSVIAWLAENSGAASAPPTSASSRPRPAGGHLLRDPIERGEPADVARGVRVALGGSGSTRRLSDKLSRELLLVESPAQSAASGSCASTPLSWLPCPFVHGAALDEPRLQPGLVCEPVGRKQREANSLDSSWTAATVECEAEHRYRGNGVVKHGGVPHGDAVDGQVVGLPGGTEWVPGPDARLRSIWCIRLPAFCAASLPKLAKSPVDIKWENDTWTSLAGFCVKSRGGRSS